MALAISFVSAASSGNSVNINAHIDTPGAPPPPPPPPVEEPPVIVDDDTSPANNGGGQQGNQTETSSGSASWGVVTFDCAGMILNRLDWQPGAEFEYGDEKYIITTYEITCSWKWNVCGNLCKR